MYKAGTNLQMHSCKAPLNPYNTKEAATRTINTTKSCKSAYKYNYFNILVSMVMKL